jgi:hypothetical protein
MFLTALQLPVCLYGVLRSVLYKEGCRYLVRLDRLCVGSLSISVCLFCVHANPGLCVIHEDRERTLFVETALRPLQPGWQW